MTKTLIITQPDDAHAVAVTLALEAKGHPVHCWHTSDFPSRASETVSFRAGSQQIDISTLPRSGYTTVWNRRPAYVIDQSVLHPADQEFAELNCRLFRKSLFDLMYPEAFWVNPHQAARRLTKLLQTARAQELGITLPDTLFTNDPDEIRSFLAAHPKGVIYKPLTSLPWKDEGTYWMPYTAIVTPHDLPEDEVLRAVPGLFQALVPKEYELRVTVMGETAFTAKILSQKTEHGRLDWRKAYSELEMEEYELPLELKDLCVELLRRLGFVFGCFDFIVTPRGEHVFLEVNQMGQFLFLESYTDLPLLDAFTDFLISRSPSFQWCRASPQIRYLEILPQVQEILETTQSRYVTMPEQVWRE